MRAVSDPIAKSWFSAIYSELNGYENFKKSFYKIFMEFVHPIQDQMLHLSGKFTRQSSETMMLHYLICIPFCKPCCKPPTSHVGRRLGGILELALPHAI
jgi:hypothetical protein